MCRRHGIWMLDETVEKRIIPVREIALGMDPDDFERGLDVALAARPRALVLDMGAITRVSSTTVAMVLWARRRCVTEGVDIVLRRLSRRSRKSLDYAGLHELVTESSIAPGATASSRRRTTVDGG
jgi:anti-anti-sigma regulatory factor